MYNSYVSDSISPITHITVNQDLTGAYLYGLVVNGLSSGTSTDGLVLSPAPNLSLGYTLKETVTLTAS